MNILIAGGSGLIGRELSTSYIKDKHDVTILSRSPEKVIGMPDKARILKWDGKTVEDWGSVIETTDIVVNLTGENLAGESFVPARWTKSRKERIVNSRLNAGRALTEAIEKSIKKPAVFVQSSGISYYGTSLTEQFTEESEIGNDFLANLCKAWEGSTEPLESLGIRRIVIRNAIVLSLNSGVLLRLILPYRLFAGGPIGSGKQFYSWINMVDEVNAIKFLINNPKANGVFNLSAPNPVTNNEFGKTIGKILRRPHYLPIPGWLMELALGEVSILVLEGQKVIPKRLLEYGFEFQYPGFESALRLVLNKD